MSPQAKQTTLEDTLRKYMSPVLDGPNFRWLIAAVVSGEKYNADNLAQIEAAVNKHSKRIDQFLSPQAGLSDLQNIIYTYVNQRSKAKALDSLSSKDFFNWLSTSKVSAPKQKKIADLNQQQGNVLESHTVSGK